MRTGSSWPFSDGLHLVAVGAIKEVADCEYPLHITTQMAGEFARVHQMVAFRLMEYRGWTFDLSPISDQRMQDCFRAALRSIRNAHRRNLRRWATPHANNDDGSERKKSRQRQRPMKILIVIVANNDEEVKLKDGTLPHLRMGTKLRRMRRGGRHRNALTYVPKAMRRYIRNPRAIPRQFPIPRRPNARAPPTEMKNSLNDFAKLSAGWPRPSGRPSPWI